MKFKAGDICINDPAYTHNCFVVLGISKNDPACYEGLSLKNKEKYRLNEEHLRKIGELSADLDIEGIKALLFQAPPLPDQDSLEAVNGRATAKRRMALSLGEDRARWQILAQAKPGDRLPIVNRGYAETVTFHHVLERGEKYVFLALGEDGKLLRWTLNCLVVPK